MSDDLVERLRDFIVDEPHYGKGLRMSIRHTDVEEAAARIEAQEAEIARLKSDRMESIDYICDLQRIIEDICHKRTIRTPKTVARFHFDKAVEYQSRASQAESALAKAVEVMRAVGHVGVDFGYGEYVLEDRFIEAARDFVKEHDKP